jgi:Spy/CpxP family protein refolding chaperone
MNQRRALTILAFAVCLATAVPTRAQQGSPDMPEQGRDGQGPPGGGQRGQRGPGGPGQSGPGQGGPGREGRPDNPSANMHMPPGRWWNDPNIAQTVGLNPTQIKKMDEIFNGARDHLIDLDGAVRKAEGGLQPLVDADQIDRAKVMAQLDRLTQAKSELEKATVQMLVDIRMQLTHDQWVKLEGVRPPRPPER